MSGDQTFDACSSEEYLRRNQTKKIVELPVHRDDGKERIAYEEDSTTSIVEQVVESEHIECLGFLVKTHLPVMGAYGRLLLGVVPVCAVKRRVVSE